MKTLLFALGVLLTIHWANADKKVVCYYGSWAVYRPGLGKFPVEEIDPFICTHLVYGFVGLSGGNTIRLLDAWNDVADNWGKNAFGRFNALKTVNPKLKTIIAIGGWNEGSVKYGVMASSADTRKIFIDSVVIFLQRYGFDGLDMDWEYPGSRGGNPEDKQNFVYLLKELKEAFKPHGYLLTAAVGAGRATMDAAYDIPQVSKYLDFINVMTYDYHGGWESFTGHNSPLYALATETPEQSMLNVNYSINYWISNGAPREKIILGMGLYGRAFTLQRAENHGLYDPAPQPGMAGQYTREKGMLGYNEICERVNKGWNVVWVDGYESPYAYHDRQWVGYDNQKSIKIKTEYAKQMNLGGGMVWSIETDDFQGTCHGHRYPLLTVIHEILIGPVTRPAPPRTTHNPHRPPVEPVEPFDPSGDCTAEGWFRHPQDCTVYWRCYDMGGRLEKQELQCQAGSVFDLQSNVCSWSAPGC